MLKEKGSAKTRAKKTAKAYNSGDSLVVTHLTTNPHLSTFSYTTSTTEKRERR
jgi:hypothetical protein